MRRIAYTKLCTKQQQKDTVSELVTLNPCELDAATLQHKQHVS